MSRGAEQMPLTRPLRQRRPRGQPQEPLAHDAPSEQARPSGKPLPG